MPALPLRPVPSPTDEHRRRMTTVTTVSFNAPESALTSSRALQQNDNASFRRVVAAVVFFCCSSLGAIFINKACLTYYKFSFSPTLMVLQSLVTFILIHVLGKLRPSLVQVVPIKAADYRRILPSMLFFVCNVNVGLNALSTVNIPMFSAFRRLTVLFVMGAEYFMLNKTHSRRVMFAIFVLTSGAFVSALGDVTFTPRGYALVFLNNALTAAYLASIKSVMRDVNLDPISLLYYTNLIAFPLILAIALLTRDLQKAYAFYYASPHLYNSAFFLPALSFVAVSAFSVNLSTSICTHVTSPLTTSVAGQVKNVLQSVLGFFSWGYVPTPLNVIGLLVALGGQLAFAYFKFLDSRGAVKGGSEAAMSAAKDEGEEKVVLTSHAKEKETA